MTLPPDFDAPLPDAWGAFPDERRAFARAWASLAAVVGDPASAPGVRARGAAALLQVCGLAGAVLEGETRPGSALCADVLEGVVERLPEGSCRRGPDEIRLDALDWISRGPRPGWLLDWTVASARDGKRGNA